MVLNYNSIFLINNDIKLINTIITFITLKCFLVYRGWKLKQMFMNIYMAGLKENEALKVSVIDTIHPHYHYRKLLLI